MKLVVEKNILNCRVVSARFVKIAKKEKYNRWLEAGYGGVHGMGFFARVRSMKGGFLYWNFLK